MTVEVMFRLGFFALEGNPIYEGIVLRLCIMCVFLEREIERETVRENRGYYSGSDVGFVSSFLLNNKKEGLVVRGGHSPNWVNHVYVCLSCFICFLCLCFHIFYVLHCSVIYNFLATGIRAEGIFG